MNKPFIATKDNSGKWSVYDKIARVFYTVTPNTEKEAIKRAKELNNEN